MKILHMMLSNFYIDGFNYQENALPRQNVKDGHDVKILASTETYVTPHKLGYVKPSCYKNEDGIEVERIPYRSFLPHFVARKMRSYPGVYAALEAYSPDIVFFHGASAFELLTAAKYKKNNPKVKFIVDQHADKNNSALNFISREFLHKRFYGPILRRVLPYIDKLFYISLEVKDFLIDIYLISEEKLEFFPLGGCVISAEYRQQRGKQVRDEMGVKEGDVVMLHAGRLNSMKKTIELLQAFSAVDNKNARLWLAGSLHEDIRNEAELLISSDSRINFLGWVDRERMQDLLCAADVYLQPGTQSALMQNAMCSGCALMLYPHKSHEPFSRGNVLFVINQEDMQAVFQGIRDSRYDLKGMSGISLEIAQELLSYEALAQRMYD